MTDDELVEELHELKRRNQTPIALIEMFDALLSLPPADRQAAPQEILRDDGRGIRAAGAQGRLTIIAVPLCGCGQWLRLLARGSLTTTNRCTAVAANRAAASQHRNAQPSLHSV